MTLGRTVAELESQLTSSEFSEWIAYYRMEPFGPQAVNLNHALTNSILYNANRGKRKPITPARIIIGTKPKHQRKLADATAKTYNLLGRWRKPHDGAKTS